MGEQAREQKEQGAAEEAVAGAAVLGEEQTICFCHNVSLGDLRRAIRAGARTVAEIQARTQASTGCGGGECDVAEILEKEAAG